MHLNWHIHLSDKITITPHTGRVYCLAHGWCTIKDYYTNKGLNEWMPTAKSYNLNRLLPITGSRGQLFTDLHCIPGFTSHILCILTLRPWTSCLLSLTLSPLIYKMRDNNRTYLVELLWKLDEYSAWYKVRKNISRSYYGMVTSKSAVYLFLSVISLKLICLYSFVFLECEEMCHLSEFLTHLGQIN